MDRIGNNWFNWADFPSIAVMDNGSMLAHWLARADDGGKFDYGIRIAKRPTGEARSTEIHSMSLDERPTMPVSSPLFREKEKLYFSRHHRSTIRIIKRLQKHSTTTETVPAAQLQLAGPSVA